MNSWPRRVTRSGLTLDFELPPYPFEKRAGEVIAQQLSEVGITANVTNVEWTTWLDRIFTQGDYDMTIIGHSEPRDIGVYGNPEYYYHYDNPEVQKLLADIETTSDEAEQMTLYRSVARTIAEDAVNVWVFQPAVPGRGAKKSLRLLARPTHCRYRPDRSVFGPVTTSHSSR